MLSVLSIFFFLCRGVRIHRSVFVTERCRLRCQGATQRSLWSARPSAALAADHEGGLPARRDPWQGTNLFSIENVAESNGGETSSDGRRA
mgnify:CR=1 FL=1